MPSDPSTAQSQASRVNGARSNGPTSDSGKKTASSNAVRHGLRADRFDLREDERQMAAELRHGLVARVMPADAIERAAVEALVVCEIKLARLDELEMRALDLALFDEDVEPSRRLPSLSTLDRYRGRLMRERRELEARLEALKQSRSQLTDGNKMTPQALRFLADLAERRAAEQSKTPANENSCTNEPKDDSGRLRANNSQGRGDDARPRISS